MFGITTRCTITIRPAGTDATYDYPMTSEHEAEQALAWHAGCEARGPVALAESPENGELVMMCRRHLTATRYNPAHCVHPAPSDCDGPVTRATLTAAGHSLMSGVWTAPGDTIPVCPYHREIALLAGEILDAEGTAEPEPVCGESYDHDLSLIDEADGWATYECRKCGAEVVTEPDEAPAEGTAEPVDVPDADRHTDHPRHIVELEGPDSAGHYGWRCTRGDAEATGLEPEEVVADAEVHGDLAAGQDTILDSIAADTLDDD